MRVQQESYPKPWLPQQASCCFGYTLLKKKKEKTKAGITIRLLKK